MNDSRTLRKISNDFADQSATYDRFRTTCEGLLKNLLSLANYRVHSVTSRLKDQQSLLRKMQREDVDYSDLADITDLVGVRIITHFEDEVDKIGTLIEKEFAVDKVRSIDKRKTLDPDRFGYLSLHYICQLSSARARLTENQDIRSLICEIQVRSILQHAWAEIEHDLGYKANTTVPAPIRRRFSRLAGMLEIADVEFTHLRDDLGNYETKVAELMVTAPATIGLDAVSLKVFIARDMGLRQLDKAMARACKIPIREPLDAAAFLDRFQFLGLQTIKDLKEAIRTHRPLLLYRWKRLVPTMPPHSSLPLGVGLFHLFQIMLAEKYASTDLIKIFRQFNLGGSDARSWISKLKKDIGDFAKSSHQRTKVRSKHR